MRKTLFSKIIPFTALCCAFSTACSSEGGGMSPSTATSSTSTVSTSGSTAPSIPGIYDTGIAGTVAGPGPNSFSAASAQLAMPGGPTFNGSDGAYPSNVTFPLITNSLQASSTGLSPVPGSQAATATVVSSSVNASTLQLNIPSVGVNVTLTGNTALVSPSQDATVGLSYVVLGAWNQYQGSGPSAKLQSNTVFSFGYETPQSAVPTSGTAQFSGPYLVYGTVYKPMGTEIQATNVLGSASMSVNFGSGTVTGSFTNMLLPNSQLWNDVSVNANIAAGTNRFGGTTAAASSPNATMSLSGSATGRIDGAFYGAAAQNLGAVWSLSDGSGSAIGTVAAGH